MNPATPQHPQETNSGDPTELAKPWRQTAEFSYDLFTQLSNAIPVGLLLLNQDWQIIHANKEIFNQMRLSDQQPILGNSFCDTVHCLYASKFLAGRSGQPSCLACELFQSVCAAQDGNIRTGDGRLAVRSGREEESLDYRVWSAPIQSGRERFVLLNLVNLADEKRRRNIEGIFLHEIINTAGAIQSLLSLNKEKMTQVLLEQASRQLLDDIDAHKQLLAAERGDLNVRPMPIQSLSLLTEIRAAYENHVLTDGRFLKISPESKQIHFISDPLLVNRVLRYMIKIALEATPQGEAVTLGCQGVEDRIQFWVHFTCYFSPEIQAKVFQKTISMDGLGRGVETYSMKIMSEQYLHGRIGFDTDPEAGSDFWVEYPLKIVGYGTPLEKVRDDGQE